MTVTVSVHGAMEGNGEKVALDARPVEGAELTQFSKLCHMRASSCNQKGSVADDRQSGGLRPVTKNWQNEVDTKPQCLPCDKVC